MLMALFKQIKFIKLINAICYCNLILMLKTEKYIELFVEKVNLCHSNYFVYRKMRMKW